MANSWKTRTGSLALSTVTALFNRIVLVLAAAAANSTAGAESRYPLSRCCTRWTGLTSTRCRGR